jgi:hypothetical protein
MTNTSVADGVPTKEIPQSHNTVKFGGQGIDRRHNPALDVDPPTT